MKERVFIASPLRGDIKKNQDYARRALLHSLNQGEAPFVPHLLYDQVLDDKIEDERNMAISSALSMLEGCQVLAVYCDLGISDGMKGEIIRAAELKMRIEIRLLDR